MHASNFCTQHVKENIFIGDKIRRQRLFLRIWGQIRIFKVKIEVRQFANIFSYIIHSSIYPVSESLTLYLIFYNI